MPSIAALAGLTLIAIWLYIDQIQREGRSKPTTYWVKELIALAIFSSSAALSIAVLTWVFHLAMDLFPRTIINLVGSS